MTFSYIIFDSDILCLCSTEEFPIVIFHATVCYLAQVDMAEEEQNHINI